MLFLVTCEVTGTPPRATVESLEAGQRTLEALVALQREGRLLGGGIYAGRMGMCFVLDVASNAELHGVVAALPTFLDASWQVTPLVGLEEDLAITRQAVARWRAARSS